MSELKKIVDQLSNLTVMEAADLVKELESAWNISTDNISTGPNATQKGEPLEKKGEEKLEYDIILESFGDKKINVIKEVKSITGLGLREARDLVESAPKSIKTSVPKAEAEDLKSKLEAIGAKITLK